MDVLTELLGAVANDPQFVVTEMINLCFTEIKEEKVSQSAKSTTMHSLEAKVSRPPATVNIECISNQKCKKTKSKYGINGDKRRIQKMQCNRLKLLNMKFMNKQKEMKLQMNKCEILLKQSMKHNKNHMNNVNHYDENESLKQENSTLKQRNKSLHDDVEQKIRQIIFILSCITLYLLLNFVSFPSIILIILFVFFIKWFILC